MWNQPYGKSDVESRASLLQPMMLESPELPWSIIPKVYSIFAIQLLATIIVATFLVTTTLGYTLRVVLIYISFIIASFITFCSHYYHRQNDHVNYLLHGVFTLSMSFLIGLSCTFTNEKVILEAGILTVVVAIALILYTFWAARRGHGFDLLGYCLFYALVVLLGFVLIQVFFPKLSTMIYVCVAAIIIYVAAIIIYGYIVYNTENLIERYSSDEYIWATTSSYMDIIQTSAISFLFLMKLIEIIVFLSVATDGF